MSVRKARCEVTPEEKRALYTGGTVRMLDTQIEAEDSNVPLCCAEMFVDKVECVPDERSECMICGRIWKLDGLRWRMSNL
jgi:hypothetical protein